MVCIRCQKRPAIIFIQRMDNGQMKQEGYCLHCARELHIKPVDDLMKQFGMSDQDLDNMENRMESMMEEMGDANPLSMMMNMANGGEDADPDPPFQTEESCLSLEGSRPTKRYESIEVAYLDEQWMPKQLSFSGMPAQIIQHELDHLEGIII